MSTVKRRDLIQRLQDIRGSRVVCLVLADRETFPPGLPGFSVALSPDIQMWLLDLLRGIGHVPALDLVLYTRGGATETVWPMINDLRAQCDKLSVLVPFRAHSAGTMICLGADEVVMSDSAELSPIDPTTGNQFNPHDTANPSNQLGISVEDVTSYFGFAHEVAGISSESATLEVFKQLMSTAPTIHPLALGNVYRQSRLTERLASELLALHLERNDDRFKEIAASFTTGFYSHLHTISRKEAQSLLGDSWVRAPNADEATAMDALFAAFSEDLYLRDRFNLPDEFGDELRKDITAIGGFLESDALSFVHVTRLRMAQRPQFPPGVQVQVPPGQQIPLAPWATRTFDWSPTAIGWVVNSEGA